MRSSSTAAHELNTTTRRKHLHYVMSSFVRTRGPSAPPGTRPSIFNSQLVTSTGLPALDTAVGAGLPLGSLWCVEEDRSTTFAVNLQRYFAVQGVAAGHKVAVVSGSDNPADFTASLPFIGQISSAAPSASVPKDSSGPNSESSQAESDLKIAWQYQKYIDKTPDASSSSVKASSFRPAGAVAGGGGPTQVPFCDIFDFRAPCDAAKVQGACLTLWLASLPLGECRLTHTYNWIKSQLEQGPSDGVVRISLLSLGSSFWLPSGTSEHEADRQLFSFLHAVLGLIRAHPRRIVCMTTLSAHTLSRSTVQHVLSLCDGVLTMRAFADGADEAAAAEFPEQHGLLQIRRTPTVNSLTSVRPEHRTYLFRMRRHKLALEPMHLRPLDTDPSQQDRASVKQVAAPTNSSSQNRGSVEVAVAGAGGGGGGGGCCGGGGGGCGSHGAKPKRMLKPADALDF